MNPQPPEQLKALGIANVVGGALNMVMGWFLGSMIWGIGGTFCTGILTCGFCPIGGLCGVVAWLIVPLGMLELGVGIALLTSPQAVKGLLPYLPFVQIPAIFLGDLVSPILGVMGAVMVRDPEIAGYIEEI